MNSRRTADIARLAGRGLAWALLVLLLSGCASQMARTQLEDVAKDWCETIRASQIIAVYPLTEDLQPGDVFLVQLPVERQQEAYKRKGFLPLDHHICRINPTGYVQFYERSIEVGDEGKPLPRYWLAPDEESPNWSKAPSAKFPTYSFSVRSGGGFNLALPVQGVPIGLSLMGGDAGEGTITIADSHTYGVEARSLYDQVRKWAGQNRSFLSRLAPEGNRQNYLRVITRVYLTSQLNVSLKSSGQMAAGVSAGAPRPVDLIVPRAGADQEETLKAYEKNINTLNKIIEGALAKAGDIGKDLLPGGTLKVASASAGSISLIESFRRPLVVGYLGFDVAIGPGGMLGPPFPTYAVLEENLRPTVAPESTSELLSNAALAFTYRTLGELKKQGDTRAGRFVEDLDKAAGLLPEAYPCNVWMLRDINGPLIINRRAGDSIGEGKRTFASITKFRGELIESMRVIKYAQQQSAVAIEPGEAKIADELKANQEALKSINERLREYSALIREANEYVTFASEEE